MTKISKEEKKNIQALKNLFFEQLDSIYSACEKTAEQFGTQTIPLSLLKEVITTVKVGMEKGINQELKK